MNINNFIPLTVHQPWLDMKMYAVTPARSQQQNALLIATTKRRKFYVIQAVESEGGGTEA